MLATIYSNSESVSAQFEPSLRRIDADIENRDSETRSRISPGAAQNAESRHNRPRDIPPADGNVHVSHDDSSIIEPIDLESA